jgi:hypothetical protein
MADGSWVSNLHLEQLDIDPLTLTDGRIWIDRTEDIVKYSVVDEVTGQLNVFTLVTEEKTLAQPLLALSTSLINTQAMLIAHLK